jgi:hypothetical protein
MTRTLTAEQRSRLDLLYATLDASYRGLREFTALQRMAINTGRTEGAGIADLNLQILSMGAGRAWGEIQRILHENDPAPATEPRPQTGIVQ